MPRPCDMRKWVSGELRAEVNRRDGERPNRKGLRRRRLGTIFSVICFLFSGVWSFHSFDLLIDRMGKDSSLGLMVFCCSPTFCSPVPSSCWLEKAGVESGWTESSTQSRSSPEFELRNRLHLSEFPIRRIKIGESIKIMRGKWDWDWNWLAFWILWLLSGGELWARAESPFILLRGGGREKRHKYGRKQECE